MKRMRLHITCKLTCQAATVPGSLAGAPDSWLRDKRQFITCSKSNRQRKNLFLSLTPELQFPQGDAKRYSDDFLHTGLYCRRALSLKTQNRFYWTGNILVLCSGERCYLTLQDLKYPCPFLQKTILFYLLSWFIIQTPFKK